MQSIMNSTKVKTTRAKRALRTRRRKASGYALVAIMTVSVFAMMLLFTLAGLTASLTRSEAYFKQKDLALLGAEVGLNYSIAMLNRSLKTGIPAVVEPVLPEVEKFSDLPTHLIPNYGDGCSVRIRIKRLDVDVLSQAQQKFSAIPTQWNSANRKDVSNWVYGDDWTMFSIPDTSYFWVVEVTSYRGIIATSIRATLSPTVALPTLATPPSKDSYFPQSVVADSLVELAPVDGYLDVLSPGDGFSTAQVSGSSPNAAFKAVVQSNTMLTANDGATIYGDLRVTNPPGASSAVAEGNNNVLVFGRLETNSVNTEGAEVSYNGFSGAPGDLPDLSIDNVWAFADWWTNGDDFWTGGMREGLNETSPLLNNPSNAQNQVSPNPVPTGSDAAPLPRFPEPPPFPDYPTMTPDMQTVAPGTYRTGSFDSSNATGDLKFNQSPGTTTIIIDDEMLTVGQDNFVPPAVHVSSNFITNGSDASTDFQIFYAGNRDINIELDGDLGGNVEMRAVIYAPSAKVTTSGFGEFSGAIVAKQLKVNHVGDLRLDPEAAKLSVNRQATSGDGNTGLAGERLPTHYELKSWQQIAGALVPKS